MANLFSKQYNKRTRFTRMCIGEAVFALMDQKEYCAIKVSDIVKKAGVSRMTFYHYYESKEEALTDYFHEIVSGYIRECIARKNTIKDFRDKASIVHALKYFDQYAVFILKMVHAKLYHIIIDAMNNYMKNRIILHNPSLAYELYFYGGALLNVFIMWEENGKKESAKEIAEKISESMKLKDH
ncbi:MAG: TetR/AcrR family transcriptional regulator [Lachnospiraceae bacterium]|nr:TetR/AcrR family transcriptional regulator [Lachnospiraceae bacterium]